MKPLFATLLFLPLFAAFAQDNTTATDVSIKLYVSVGHVDLTHKKGQSAPATGSSRADAGSDKYTYESYTRTGGINGALDYVAAQDAHAGWEQVSDDGRTVTWRKLKDSSTSSSGSAPARPPASGSATLTITGKANVTNTSYVVTITDVLASQPIISGDPHEGDTAAQELKQELCHVTTVLLDYKSLKLSKTDIGELATNPQARITKNVPFKFFGAEKELPVVITRKLEISGELGDPKTYSRSSCSP